MADQSIALQVRPPSFDLATPLLEAAQIGTQSSLGNYYQSIAQIENQQAQGQGVAFRSQLVRNAAAHALDAASWDQAMQAAADQGAPEAAQYVGRYTPLLQQRLFEAYGGSPSAGTAAGASPAGAGGVAGAASPYDRAFQNVPPAQMAQSLTRLNMISDALSTVRDPQSWNAAIAQLQAAGIPQAAQFAGAYSPLRVQQLYNAIQPVRTYLQDRVTTSAAGLPGPTVQPLPSQAFKPVPNATSSTGGPVLYNEEGQVIAPQVSLPPGTISLAQYNQRLTPLEGTGQNPRSSATGPGQFTDSTLLDTVKQVRPDLAAKFSVPQLRQLMATDPMFATQMLNGLTTGNAQALTAGGYPVTSATLMLAHRFGAQGAQELLSAAPNTPMSEIFPKKVIAANPELANMTAGQYAQMITRQVGNDPVAVNTPQMATKGEYGNPQRIEVDATKNPKLPGSDPSEGGTVQVMAQQDKRTGQWVTADQNRIPINSSNFNIVPESAGAGGGGRFGAQMNRIMVGARMATNEIGNLAQLPITADTGMFGFGARHISIMDAVKDNLRNTIQPQEVQDFNTSMIGLGKALATLESGGLQTNQALIEQFDKLALQPGDTQLTKLRKLGTMRQDAEAAIDGTLASPLIGKSQAKDLKQLKANLAKAIPWLPNDVTALEYSTNPKDTLATVGKRLGLGKVSGTLGPEDAQALDWAKANPSDPRAAQIKQRLGVQ